MQVQITLTLRGGGVGKTKRPPASIGQQGHEDLLQRAASHDPADDDTARTIDVGSFILLVPAVPQIDGVRSKSPSHR